MLRRCVEIFFSIPAPLAMATVFLLTAAETAFFLGFFIPGELAVILAGVLASRAHVPLAGVLLAGVLGPIAGDSIGYYLGRRYGRRFIDGKRKRRWARARAWLRRRGASAVFLGRFTAFLRSVMPAAAGVARMPYRQFLFWDAAAGLLWGVGSALLGYFAGQNYESLARWASHFSLALLALLLAGVGFYLLRRRVIRGRRGRRRSVRRARTAS
jgi:membrane protein DedA with SNARE-associated domain